MPTATNEVQTLASKVEDLTKCEAFIHKKLICCPPNAELEAVVDDLLPHAHAMVDICRQALGG